MISVAKRVVLYLIFFPLFAIFFPVMGILLFAPVIFLVIPASMASWLDPGEPFSTTLLVGVAEGLILYHYRNTFVDLYSRYVDWGDSLVKPFYRPLMRLFDALEK